MRRLLGEVGGCRLCADRLPLGPKPIVQIGARARILIASQAPGRRAHQSGVPFADRGGDTLRHWLGVDRATFYDPEIVGILPMGLCYPGRGPGGELPPRPECAPRWRGRLRALMPEVRLTFVLGRHAQAHHLEARCKPTLPRPSARFGRTCRTTSRCPTRRRATAPGFDAIDGSKATFCRPCALRWRAL